jgi:hypothetical protein
MNANQELALPAEMVTNNQNATNHKQTNRPQTFRNREGHDFSRAKSTNEKSASAPEVRS